MKVEPIEKEELFEKIGSRGQMSLKLCHQIFQAETLNKQTKHH